MTTSPIIQRRDLLALLRNHLLADDTVTDLVGDAVRTAHVVNPDATLEYPLVILEVTSGSSGYQGGIRRVNVDVYAYSDESQDAADTVYDAVYLALQAARLWDSTSTISAAGFAQEASRPVEGYNEVTRSWYARGTWTIRLAA